MRIFAYATLIALGLLAGTGTPVIAQNVTVDASQSFGQMTQVPPLAVTFNSESKTSGVVLGGFASQSAGTAFVLTNVNSGLDLNVDESSTVAGADVIQWPHL